MCDVVLEFCGDDGFVCVFYRSEVEEAEDEITSAASTAKTILRKYVLVEECVKSEDNNFDDTAGGQQCV